MARSLDPAGQPGPIGDGGVAGPDRLRETGIRAGRQVRPGSPEAATASGYDISLTVPQSKAADGLATPPVKDVSIEFPTGTTISPAAADGLGACSDAQVALESREPEQCPDASKIGTVEIDTPLLEAPLEGSLYQGTQQSNDPQSGKMYRLFLVAAGSGVRIKLEGGLKVDPATGQLTASFDDNPQLPFERLDLQLKGGSRAPLVTPAGLRHLCHHRQADQLGQPE